MQHNKTTKKINIGGRVIGGGSEIAVQSMTNTDTKDIQRTINQIRLLENCGCQIIRVAVPDSSAAKAVGEIKKNIGIPLVADIHFDHRLALMCLEGGVDKIRINPGNIGADYKVSEVVKKARERNVPIRIGVNGGSLEKDILDRCGGITAEALVMSAEGHINILRKHDFEDIVVSLKASNVMLTIEAYTLMSERFSYPLHIGVTEAGTLASGIIKSSVGIGSLLSQGIGDTIRVSLTADPVHEVKTAISILKSLGIRRGGVEFISCPTCGRCEIDLVSIATEIENRVESLDLDIKIAVMGCVVNGPGEAREADIGVAGGRGVGIIFKKGKVIKKVLEKCITDALIEEIKKL